MTVQTQRRGGGGYLDRPAPSGLADVVEIILDKGIVIDAYVRVSLVGIELLTIDARIVIASVDTYLRFAEATNRLDLIEQGGGKPLDEFIGDLQESGAGRKVKGAVSGAKKALTPGSDDDDEERERRPAKKSPRAVSPLHEPDGRTCPSRFRRPGRRPGSVRVRRDRRDGRPPRGRSRAWTTRPSARSGTNGWPPSSRPSPSSVRLVAASISSRFSGTLDAVAEVGPVIPVQFGSVLADETGVIEDLLAPREAELVATLDGLRGRAQFTIQARYLEAVVLSEIVASSPEIAELRRRTRELPERRGLRRPGSTGRARRSRH